MRYLFGSDRAISTSALVPDWGRGAMGGCASEVRHPKLPDAILWLACTWERGKKQVSDERW